MSRINIGAYQLTAESAIGVLNQVDLVHKDKPIQLVRAATDQASDHYLCEVWIDGVNSGISVTLYADGTFVVRAPVMA